MARNEVKIVTPEEWERTKAQNREDKKNPQIRDARRIRYYERRLKRDGVIVLHFLKGKEEPAVYALAKMKVKCQQRTIGKYVEIIARGK